MAKFPPLGLMKIATAHRILGDDVCFVKGKSRGHRDIPLDTRSLLMRHTQQSQMNGGFKRQIISRVAWALLIASWGLG